MKKIVKNLYLMLLILLVGWMFPVQGESTELAYAAEASQEMDQLTDGNYLIDYVVLRAEDDSVSIANDYFQKKAGLTMRGDEAYLFITLNQSEWIKSLENKVGEEFIEAVVQSGNSEENTRIVYWKLEDLQEPTWLQMHIVISSMEPVYDHSYTVRLQLDQSSIEISEDPFWDVEEIKGHNSDSGKSGLPQIAIYAGVSLIVILLIAFLIYKRKS